MDKKLRKCLISRKKKFVKKKYIFNFTQKSYFNLIINTYQNTLYLPTTFQLLYCNCTCTNDLCQFQCFELCRTVLTQCWKNLQMFNDFDTCWIFFCNLWNNVEYKNIIVERIRMLKSVNEFWETDKKQLTKGVYNNYTLNNSTHKQRYQWSIKQRLWHVFYGTNDTYKTLGNSFHVLYSLLYLLYLFSVYYLFCHTNFFRLNVI